MITISASDGGEFQAYMTTPEAGSGPGLVLLQEIFGINAYLREMAETFAQEGYVVLVPDLFWRMQSGVNLGYGDEDLDLAFSFYQKFDVDRGILDVADTIRTLRSLPSIMHRQSWFLRLLSWGISSVLNRRLYRCRLRGFTV